MTKYTIINEQVPENVVLVAVSKRKPETDIMNIYNQGHKIFGENKVQELISKYKNLPKDIEWHMIGHLQRNKVKLIAPFIKMIHSVDSLTLLQEINKRAIQNNITIDCLLEIHIAQETSKLGLSESEAIDLLESEDFTKLENINIRGLMGMATHTNDDAQIFSEFQHLQKIFTQMKSKYFADNKAFSEISMGMSNDFKVAINAGSTMVRVGSLIFGERN